MEVSCVSYIVYMGCEYNSSFQLLLSIPRCCDHLYVPITTVHVHIYILIVCNRLFSAVQIPRYLVDLDSPIAIVYCVRLIYVLDMFCGGRYCIPTLYHETYTCTWTCMYKYMYKGCMHKRIINAVCLANWITFPSPCMVQDG